MHIKNNYFQDTLAFCTQQSSILRFLSCTFADINECAATVSPCNPNAMCANTFGNFECTCKAGYTGDGRSCVGTYNVDFYLQKIQIEKKINARLAFCTDQMRLLVLRLYIYQC